MKIWRLIRYRSSPVFGLQLYLRFGGTGVFVPGGSKTAFSEDARALGWSVNWGQLLLTVEEMGPVNDGYGVWVM